MWCGIVVRRDPVVGGDDVARLGVDQLGQLVVGDPALPLVLAASSPGLGRSGQPPRAQREPADQLVADRAVAVGPDQVRDRARCGGAATRPAPAPLRDVEHAEARLGHARQRRAPSSASASGSSGSAPSASLTIGPWWVRRTSSRSGSRALDLDLLLVDLERPPLALELVRRRRRSARRRGPWTSAITLVKLQATSLFWPKTIPSRPGKRGAAAEAVVDARGRAGR